jgi:hypothetical protein
MALVTDVITLDSSIVLNEASNRETPVSVVYLEYERVFG